MGVQLNSTEILELIKKAQSTPVEIPLAKSTFSQSLSATSGITQYDLEPGAKFLVPKVTPLRNSIPRVSGAGGVQAAWRAITAINSGQAHIGVSGGNRGAVLDVTTTDYVAAYKGIGLDASVDFEAQYAGYTYDDARALAARALLQSVMTGEEGMILGGNSAIALGTTPTPTLSTVTTGGSLAAATWSVIVVALSHDAFINAKFASATCVRSKITRTNADGSVDVFGGGAARKSAAAAQVTTGATSIINASVAAVTGALGYAWFWGTAGAETLGALTTINSTVITAAATGTQLASSLLAEDWSQSALAFDGLLYQALKPNSGSLVVTMPTGVAGVGTPLTADGAGGVVEIETVLKYMWDNYRISPTEIWVGTQEAQNISKKILAGNANSAHRFTFTTAKEAIGGGIMVTSYLNKYSMDGGQTIDIRLHPNMPNGTILFLTREIPYNLDGVANVIQVRTRQEYNQIDWPLRSRKYEIGVYADEVLQHFAPFTMAIITNIANG